MRMLDRWVVIHLRIEIKSENIKGKLGVALIEDKMRKNRL